MCDNSKIYLYVPAAPCLGAYSWFTQLNLHQQDPVTRAAIIGAYAKSISEIWLVMTPILGACAIMGVCFGLWAALWGDDRGEVRS